MRSKIVVAVCLMLALCGCGHQPQESKRVTLRFGIMGSKQETDYAQMAAKSFEKEHPNIKVVVEPVAGMAYDMKLIMQSASNTLPDVVWLCDSLVPTFIKSKVVRNLDSYISEDKDFDINNIYPQMLDTGRDRANHLYMMPRELGVVVMFYNRTMLRKVGLSDPDPNWNYDDFLRMAKKLTLKDKHGKTIQYAYNAYYTWPGIYSPLVASFGGTIISPDGKRSMLSSKESIKGLHAMIDLINVHKVALAPNSSGAVPGSDAFAAGQVAMFPNTFSQISVYRTTMKKVDWDIAVMPAGPKKRCINMGSSGYGISRDCKHTKEAWMFLKYLVEPKAQRMMGRCGIGIPVLKSLAHDPCWRADNLPPKHMDAFIQTLKYGVGWRDITLFMKPEASDAFAEAFEKTYLGIEPLEKAFKTADEKITALAQRESERN